MRSLAVIIALAATPAVAAPATANQFRGTVDAARFGAFETFVADRIDKPIDLEVDIRPGPALSASVEQGQFVVYRVKAPKSEIVASSGFTPKGGGFVFSGRYTVRYGGMHQGISSYALEPVAPAGGAAVR